MQGNKIRERRQALKMTQAELSKKAKVSRATISAIENGTEIDVKVSTLKALADALKCKVQHLFA